ncbi:MAG: hypothetical protein JO034_24570 [Singulisphaera sp.]|nr:hypothetical protein [Singulisphaera sp.]
MIVKMVLTAAGCQRLPIARVAELTPLPPTRPKLAEPTPAPDPAPVLRPSPTTYPAPSLSATPAPPPSQTPVVEVARKGSATPLLDRALVRAEALEHLDDDPPCDCDFECDVPEPSHMTPAASIAEPKVKPSALADLAVKDRTETPAAPRPIDPERPAKVVTPSDLWRQDLERLRAMAHERAIGSPELAALQARLLDWIADPEAGNSPLWRTVLRALAATSGPDPSEDRTRAAEIRQAVEALEEQAPLEIADLHLCRAVHGFGDFDALDAATCRSGQSLIVYCELSGVRYERNGETFRSRLSSRVEIVPTKGGKSVWEHSVSASEVSRRRRRDYYVACPITLPTQLAPGSYELHLTQKDEVSGRATSSAIALVLQP